MKKILYTAALGTMLVLGAGCSKTKLDLYPYNQVATEVAFTDQQSITFDVNGMYQGLRASTSYFVNGQWNILADVLADNLVLSQAGRQSQKTYYQWTYNSLNTYRLFDNGGYSTIRRANAILENITGFTAGAFKNDAIGQALAVRALVHFDMARVYSKIYVNASDADYTLPYVITTSATNLPGSEPVKGFYDKVIADLVQAEGLINPVATNTNIRLNRQAVAGLLARVYLYKGDYANCIAAATRAIGAVPTAATIPSIANFPGIWTDLTTSDGAVLFKVKNTSLDNLNTQGVNYYQAVTGGIKSEYVVAYNFNQLFDVTDVRKSSYISTSAYQGVPQNHIIKYAGRAGTPAGVVDAKVIRVAEVLLARAEAEYRTGAVGAAAADLVLLKSNRYTGYSSVADLALTGAPLLNEILKQRRLELAFEGDRFWDLKRLNLPVIRDAVHGENADGSGAAPSSTIATLPAGDFRFNLPYPQGELTFNPAIKQNPGY